jgi:hypothetical protein
LNYTQSKLEDPERYIMRDESVVPPGDCIIVEFDVSKSSTDRLCQQYGVRDADRCTQFGVSEFNPDLCNIKQLVTYIEPLPTYDESEEITVEEPIIEETLVSEEGEL